jgi:hypothetical protein
MKDTMTSRGVTFRRPLGDEKNEQASICNLVGQIGGVVYTLGTTRAMCCGVCGSPSTDPTTRQTPGLADLAIFLPPNPRRIDGVWTFVWVECKGRRGTLSEEQLRFRRFNQVAGVAHLVGGLDEFIAYLELGGWVKKGAPR